MNVEAIQETVHRECSRPGIVLGLDFYTHHLAPVARYCAELSFQLGVSPTIPVIAAWLHDISAVRDFSTLPRHAELSADCAAGILETYSVPPSQIERICQCIRSHSTPLPLESHTIEAVVLSNADAMAQIAQPAYWSHFAFGIRGLGFEAGRQWLASLVESKFTALIAPAQAMVVDDYSRALAVFAHDANA